MLHATCGVCQATASGSIDLMAALMAFRMRPASSESMPSSETPLLTKRKLVRIDVTGLIQVAIPPLVEPLPALVTTLWIAQDEEGDISL